MELSPHPSRAGTALVLVLTFVVLLSALLTAFLSRAILNRQIAGSSAGDFGAEQVAQAAVNTFIGDLRLEMDAGSKQNGDPAGAQYTDANGVHTTYVPATPKAAAPARIGEDPALKTLLRRTVRSDSGAAEAFPAQGGVAAFDPAVYPNTAALPPNRASASGSATSGTLVPSVNGRVVTMARWNKPALVDPTYVPTDTTSTPAANSPTFQAPDWVILTRAGEKAFSAWSSTLRDTKATNNDFALGRYAYTVYNEGALLDVNLAGYPSVVDGGNDNQVRIAAGKPAPFFADLRHLAPMGSTTGWLTTAQVDAFLNWRNATTASSADAFENYATTIANKLGFIGVASGDQGLVSRQDLLGYAKANNWDTNALRFLGTSSRELNSPSFSPATPTSTNPNFALALVNGVPIRRFPLNTNLAILQTATDAASISKLFGLTAQSDSTNTHRHWSYADTPIKTLDQVITSRAPNFFELLKASIGSASIGPNQDGHAYQHSYLQQIVPNGVSDNNYLPDGVSDDQIIRIGANIIDQYKSDNYPTTILFNGYDFAGIENLPYLSELCLQLYRPGSSNDVDDNSQHYLYFELWNPHQPDVTAVPGPTNIRVTVNPQASYGMPYWTAYPPYAGQYDSTSPAYQPFPNYTLDCAPLSATNNLDFREPDVMQNPSGGGYHKMPGETTQGTNSYLFPDPSTNADGTPITTVYPPKHYLKPGDWSWFNDRIIINQAVFRLEYQDADGWHPYTTFGGYFLDGGDDGGLTGLQNEGAPVIQPFYNWGIYPTASITKPDPRTYRYGVNMNYPSATTNPPYTHPTNYPNDAYMERGMVPGDTPGETAGNNGGDQSNYPGASLCKPGMLYRNLQSGNPNLSSGGDYPDSINIYTTGNDGVARPADGALDENVANPMHPSGGTVNPARPVILHRPFRSVGELGYVFRDEPWKTLDLFSPLSADAALLDVFCLEDSETVAGKVDLRTPNAEVVKTLLGGALRQEASASSGISAADADSLAGKLVASIQTANLVNKADFVTGVSTTSVDTASPPLFPAIKTQREAPVRALAQNTSTRTWNLLVDIVAQAGRYPPTATGLDNFVVEGEKRYWLHLAIDRYTGKVVSQSLERVNE